MISPRPAVRTTARVVAMYLASRVAVFACYVVAARVQGGVSVRGVLSRWDASWYFQIITNGYPSDVPAGASPIAFFPLFPLTVKSFTVTLGTNPLWTATVVNLVLGCAFISLLWWFTADLTDRSVADRTVVLVAFFPGSIALSLAYSEALMLTLAVGCLWALVKRRWLLAGVLAAGATATRPNAIALVVACAAAAAVAIWQRREWKALVAPALAPIGLVAFFVYLKVHTGVTSAWFVAQRNGWNEKFDFGLRNGEKIIDTLRDPFADYNVLVAAVGTVLIIGLCVLMVVWWRPPAAVLAYTLTIAALTIGSSTLGGRPRFILTAFPLFIAVALAVRNTWLSVLVGIGAVATGALVFVTANSLLLTP